MIDIQFIHILVFFPLIISLISFNKTPKYIPLILISTSITSSFLGSIVDLLSAFIEHRRENPVIFSRWDESMKLTLFLNVFSNCFSRSVANRANKIAV